MHAKFITGNIKGKFYFWGFGHRLGDNIENNFTERGWENMNWAKLVWSSERL
jgi:hypothetical protein